MYKTYAPSENEITEKWLQVDATGQRLGRLATIVAELLLDKGNVLMRDYLTPKVKVVVTNAEQLDVTANRRMNKLYTSYSGYPSGLKVQNMDEMFAKFPERVIELAVRRMLPKNRRGREIFTNLYVYRGSEHKHTANQPQTIDPKSIKL